jgi:enoyl-CoA hydratase/carnithine racemase
METETIRTSTDDEGVCTVTLNRPDALNAMNGELVDFLWHTFRSLRHDDDVRVVILTGAGDKAFCVGADLAERREMSEDDTRERLDDYRGAFDAIADLPKPVICAINGYAFGGGLEMALCCDIRVVNRETKVGLTETKLGIIPGAGGTQRLPRLIGEAQAKELIFTGRRISGEKATSIGLANRAAEPGDVREAARELAGDMLDSAPIALAQAKRAIDAGMQTDLATGLDIEKAAYEVTLPTEDRQEGLEAFKEGRDPDFKGQ